MLYLRGDTLTTMTLLGLAAALALVVDDAVGDVTSLPARLRQRRDERQSTAIALTEAVTARRGPLTYATVVTLLALAPLTPAVRAAAPSPPRRADFVLAVLASWWWRWSSPRSSRSCWSVTAAEERRSRLDPGVGRARARPR